MWIVIGLASLLLLSACTGAVVSVPEVSPDSPAEGDQSPGNESTEVGETKALPESSGQGSDAEPSTAPDRDFQIVTLLPRDAIPAIDDPVFLTVPEADEVYRPDELVMGVVFGDEARAYSVELLSSHEIVNDTVGGRKIAVTW